ncbi:hypothetical protein Aph01nite_29210 [Acrocarpospora phusangensis]|uniref:Uncharacterized protein n=1 Tax=Acrocarpospora phusangensis TaxID=1070424 RepID=A0A919Q9C6_9ACTN|nr:hypothetical protein [Acrocarpospora phusangensis]GIH24611.1 hypothetical protein Aph01nite_29210 [Acrocarpospora phusangensis]
MPEVDIGEVLNEDDRADIFQPTEQMNIFDSNRQQLSHTEQKATWKSFAAPLTSRAGAVVEEPDLVEMVVAIIGVYSEHHGENGMTFAQIRETLLRHGVTISPTAINARLEHLHAEGFLESYLPKVYQGKYVIKPAGLVGALAAQRVVEHGGIDEMVLLLDRTRAALQMDHPDPRRVLNHLQTCRFTLTVFARDLQRCVATGTSAELITTGRQHDHSGYTQQVADLNALVTSRFAGVYELEDAGAALIEAEQFYRAQVRAAIGKVLAQGGASLNFDVLTPREYEDAAITSSLDALAAVGAHLVADAPEIVIDVSLMINALDHYRPRSKHRIRPPEPPAGAHDPDPIAAVEQAAREAKRRRRLGLEALLGGRSEADLTEAMKTSWPAALQILTDAMALDSDKDEPFVLTIDEHLLVDREAPVTYLHPARLIRTDVMPESLESKIDQLNTTDGGDRD